MPTERDGLEHQRPRVAIVSSAELASQPGAPLTAGYWVNRQPGEDYPAFTRRRQAEELERQAADHDAAAARLRQQAADVLAEGEADGQGA